MGRKSSKGSVAIDKDKNRIRLRWRYLGKRYSLNLFLFNSSNLKIARKIAVTIESDLLNDNFDVTLARYRPGLLTKPEKTKLPYQLFEEWVSDYLHRDCEMQIDYWALRNMLKRWGDFHLNDALKKFNGEKIGERTYNRRLTMLKKFCSWLKHQGLMKFDPFEQVSPKSIPKTQNNKRKPFTKLEIKKILSAFLNDTYCPRSSRFKHSHYYPFIFFIFATGVRNAEAVGLRVSKIDVKRKRIVISEVLARSLKSTNPAARIRKETKNGKVRELPLTRDLLKILKPLLKNKQPDDLVFTSPTGLPIDDRMFQRRVFRPILKHLKIELRDMYACRHTFSSRCIDSGLSPVMTAFLMGNNPETVLRNYTHQLRVPKKLPPIK